MQQYISTWVIAVTIAVLFSAMVSAMLPDTNIKKYVNVVLGIVVTMIILSPLFALIGGADLQYEVDNTLNNINEACEYEYDSSLYKDYIFKVYMGDE